jgi:cytochrome c nitrite reductase small subunit
VIADGTMDSGRYCFDCHRTVAHGERGISISPYREEWVYSDQNLEGQK